MTRYTLTLKIPVEARNFESAKAKADRLKRKVESKQTPVCEAWLRPGDKV